MTWTKKDTIGAVVVGIFIIGLLLFASLGDKIIPSWKEKKCSPPDKCCFGFPDKIEIEFRNAKTDEIINIDYTIGETNFIEFSCDDWKGSCHYNMTILVKWDNKSKEINVPCRDHFKDIIYVDSNKELTKDNLIQLRCTNEMTFEEKTINVSRIGIRDPSYQGSYVNGILVKVPEIRPIIYEDWESNLRDRDRCIVRFRLKFNQLRYTDGALLEKRTIYCDEYDSNLDGLDFSYNEDYSERFYGSEDLFDFVNEEWIMTKRITDECLLDYDNIKLT